MKLCRSSGGEGAFLELRSESLNNHQPVQTWEDSDSEGGDEERGNAESVLKSSLEESE